MNGLKRQPDIIINAVMVDVLDPLLPDLITAYWLHCEHFITLICGDTAYRAITMTLFIV